MSEQNEKNEESVEGAIGAVVWRDLTVENATAVRDFYCAVAGWTFAPLDMGGYDDYSMQAHPSGQTVAGICHARGENANLPAQWLVYINVEDVDKSAEQCVALGGTLVDGPRSMGGGRFCVIRDPAGAVCALISQ